jgi:hypothetical protein
MGAAMAKTDNHDWQVGVPTKPSKFFSKRHAEYPKTNCESAEHT